MCNVIHDKWDIELEKFYLKDEINLFDLTFKRGFNIFELITDNFVPYIKSQSE